MVTSDSSRALWLRQARAYLRDADPVLARLVDDRPAFDPRAWLAQRAVQFYAADDAAAGDLVAGLIRAGGYEPVRVGGLDQSIRIEMFGDLHEYGALGRVVSRSEALAAI